MTKKCTKCNKIKELIEFSKQKKGKYGLRSRCRTCSSSYSKNYYIAYYKTNFEKVRSTNAAYKKANPDKVKAITMEWQKANQKRLSEWGAAYYINNLKKIKARQSAYAKANPDKINSLSAKRKAAKLQRTPSWLTKNDFKEIQKFYILSHKLTEETGIQYHVDHIIPLRGKNVSGLHVPWNLQVIPAYGPNGNCSKNNKLIEL